MTPEGQQKYQAILEAIPDLIFILDSKGIHLEFHSNFTEELYIKPSNIIGKSVFELLPDDVSHKYMQNINSTLKENKTQIFEYKLPFEDGDRFFEGRMVKLDDNNVLLMVRNVTDHYKHQEAQRKIEKELKEARKLETVGKIVCGISHDFNNILTILDGNFRRIKKMNHPEINKHIQNAQNSINRAKRLTNSLLSFVYKGPPEKNTIDLKEFIKEFNEIIQSTPMAPCCEVEITPTTKIKKLWLDKNSLENSLINLIINSRDAIILKNQPGLIKIDTQITNIDHDLAKHHHCTPGEYVQFIVEDDGVGIPEKLFDKIFEPLFTTKPRGKGTGLGLSMVQRFVKDNDGFLHISSKVGVGTRISMYLPTSSNQENKEDKKPTLVKCPSDKEVSICLVDDEIEVLNLLADDLKDLGYIVYPCSSPNEALTLAKSKNIDILLTDLSMPFTINGFDLAEMIIDIQQDISVIFLTGFVDEDLLPKLREIGPVLLKPIGLTAISETLAQAIKN